jgi:hypothetical protein
MRERWSGTYPGDVVDPSLTGYLAQVLAVPLDRVNPRDGVLRIIRDAPGGEATAIIGLRAWNEEQRDYCQAAPARFPADVPKGYTTSKTLNRKVTKVVRTWSKATVKEVERL